MLSIHWWHQAGQVAFDVALGLTVSQPVVEEEILLGRLFTVLKTDILRDPR